VGGDAAEIHGDDEGERPEEALVGLQVFGEEKGKVIGGGEFLEIADQKAGDEGGAVPTVVGNVEEVEYQGAEGVEAEVAGAAGAGGVSYWSCDLKRRPEEGRQERTASTAVAPGGPAERLCLSFSWGQTPGLAALE
jgi:hypothetical protein